MIGEQCEHGFYYNCAGCESHGRRNTMKLIRGEWFYTDIRGQRWHLIPTMDRDMPFTIQLDSRDRD